MKLEDVLPFVLTAGCPVVLAFVMDSWREGRAAAKREREAETERVRAKWGKAVSDTEAYCRALVAWLQVRVTYPDQSWPIYHLLAAGGFSDRDVLLLGDTGPEFFRRCHALFGLDDPKVVAVRVSEALRPILGHLRLQRERVEEGNEPERASEDTRRRIEDERRAFLAAQEAEGSSDSSAL